MKTLPYPLREGFVDHWLWTLEPDAPLTAWQYARCGEDHRLEIIDSSGCGCRAVSGAALTQLETRAGAPVSLILTGRGITRLSINDAPVWTASERTLDTGEVRVALPPGSTTLRVDFADPRAWGTCVLRCALRLVDAPPDLVDAPPDLSVQLPTMASDPARRAKFERVFEQAIIDRDVFTFGEMIQVVWDSLDERCTTQARLQHHSGRLYAQSTKMLDAETRTLLLGKALNIPDGSYHALIMPDSEEFYGGIGYSRSIPFTVSTAPFSQMWYGDLDTRRAEALEHAAEDAGLFGVMARLALGRHSQRDDAVIRAQLEHLDAHCPDQWREAVALIGILARSAESIDSVLRQRLEAFAVSFHQIVTDPPCAADAPYDDGIDLLQRTATLLIAQQLNDTTHQPLIEAELARWMAARGTGGLAQWHAPAALESLVLALTHLTDLASAQTIRELAAVLLDRLLLGLAINSFKGSLASARRTARAPDILNGRLDPTAGISRLLWGAGVYNAHLAGVVSLACAQAYEVPSLVQAVGLDYEEATLSTERHRSGGEDASTVTYRTADYLLSSAQDYRAGSPGNAEHIWQAALSPDAIVFTNHPDSASDRVQPGFWCGSARLPRVAQWRDALIAIYSGADAGMNCTHAFFPLWAFDEHVLTAPWAFARVGEGYLALHSSSGYRLMTSGAGAYRELRTPGRANVWLCQMGSAAQDGDFGGFQERVARQPLHVDGLAVAWTTVRGDQLQFGWEADMRVNGQIVPLAFERPVDNRFCQGSFHELTLDIRVHDYVMRLNFEPD